MNDKNIRFCLIALSSLYNTWYATAAAQDSTSQAEPEVVVIVDGREYRQGEIALPSGVSTGNAAIVEARDTPIVSKEAQDTKSSSIEDKALGNAKMLSIRGRNLGTLPIRTSVSSGKLVDDEELSDFLGTLEPIEAMVNASSYQFDYVRSYPGSRRISFAQVINDVKLPNSQLVFNNEGIVTSVQMVLVDPHDPLFDGSTWLSEKALSSRLKAIVEADMGGFDTKHILEPPRFRIIYGKDFKHLVPVYEVLYGYGLVRIRIHAQTGALVSRDRMGESLVQECSQHPEYYTFFANLACEADAENSHLALDAIDDDPLNQLLGSSITYRIAVGPQAGRKVFTLQTLPACDEPFDDRVGQVAGSSLHAGVAARADERQKLERLCRYISRPAVPGPLPESRAPPMGLLPEKNRLLDSRGCAVSRGRVPACQGVRKGSSMEKTGRCSDDIRGIQGAPSMIGR